MLRMYGGGGKVYFEGDVAGQAEFDVGTECNGHFVLASSVGDKLRVYPHYNQVNGQWHFEAKVDRNGEVQGTDADGAEVVISTSGEWTATWRAQGKGEATVHYVRAVSRGIPQVVHAWCGIESAEILPDGTTLRRAFASTGVLDDCNCPSCWGEYMSSRD